MTDEQLAELRMHKPAEVARMLNIPITRLETWVREERVPHLRAGVLRGVEFTAEDIRQIGRMLPDLMGGRRGGSSAADTQRGAGKVQRSTTGAAGPQSDGAERASSVPEPPPVVDIAGWAQLKAHPRRARGR